MAVLLAALMGVVLVFWGGINSYANEVKILSCQPDEYSIEGKQWGGGRGAFSYHFLNGLFGMADNNADLFIDLKEIGRYLEDNVSSEVAPESQNPMTIGSKSTKVSKVYPEILAQLKEAQRTQMPQFDFIASNASFFLDDVKITGLMRDDGLNTPSKTASFPMLVSMKAISMLPFCSCINRTVS